MASWQFWIQWVFNYRNARDDHRRFRLWMAITSEMPPKNTYKLVGLSREENRQFWLSEDALNYFWNKGVELTFVIFCLIFNLQHFLIR